MSARRTYLRILMDGVDVSSVFNQYLLSICYTDFEADKADDLQIRLHDVDTVWLTEWLTIATGSRGSIKGMVMSVFYLRDNWGGYGDATLLYCGEFELDSINASGPPSIIVLKATALPFSQPVRKQKRNKAWENYTLKKIAEEIAKKNGMKCFFDSDINPKYKRIEQADLPDIQFLKKLCDKAGLSLKATAKRIVIFDQAKYEAMPPVMVISYGGGYTRYRLSTKEADVKYTSCRVQYTNPETGKTISYTFVDPDAKKAKKDTVRLEIREKVSSKAEAEILAKKMLRLKNKFQHTGSFTFPGKPYMLAGVAVHLAGFGTFDGKYMISEARHEITEGAGYETEIDLRTVLEGY